MKRVAVYLGLSGIVFLMSACNSGAKKEPEPAISLEPFRVMARNAHCADRKNKLFLIDGHMVFWDRESSCADAAYAQVLYDSTIDHVLCEKHDSIAGPQRSCTGSASDSTMFDTILDHLDAPDLGLGKDHRVKPVGL